MTPDSSPGVRRSELLGAIALATDFGMAQPVESGLANCLVATALAERIGLDPAERQRTYDLALLQHVGCTAASAQVAAVMGDELVMRAHASTLDFADRRAMIAFLMGHVRRTNAPMARPAALVRAVAHGGRVAASVVDVCEAARMLGERLGYDEDSLRALGCMLEYWDGRGFPGNAHGESIPTQARVVQVATLAVAAHRAGGVEAARDLVAARSGRSLGPTEAAAFLADPLGMLAPVVTTGSLWDATINAEPVTSPTATGAQIDAVLRTVADFVDLKEPCLAGHSAGVAALAAAAAKAIGLPVADVATVRRAGWLHDIGRVGVSSNVWGHAGPLSIDQWERVRLHPYYTHRVLDRTPFLRQLADVASAHHERGDGSGYYRSLRGGQIPVTGRLLAAADAYHAMTEPRPYRPALSATGAARQVSEEVRAGRLDAQAADAVLAAAGQAVGRRTQLAQRAHSAPAALTPREIEILGNITLGLSIRQIARDLSIAPKTVDGHIQRIYAKTGVNTRAGAALFAMRHDLVRWRAEDGENSP